MVGNLVGRWWEAIYQVVGVNLNTIPTTVHGVLSGRAHQLLNGTLVADTPCTKAGSSSLSSHLHQFTENYHIFNRKLLYFINTYYLIYLTYLDLYYINT